MQNVDVYSTRQGGSNGKMQLVALGEAAFMALYPYVGLKVRISLPLLRRF